MPVPKRKTSKARRDSRQSCKFIRPKAIAACAQCKEPIAPHQACKECGFYKGKKVLATKSERGELRATVRAAAAQKGAEGHDDHEGHDHAEGAHEEQR